jgi:hypothetical protein
MCCASSISLQPQAVDAQECAAEAECSTGDTRAQLPPLMISVVMRSRASILEHGRMIAVPLTAATSTSRDSIENTARRRPLCWVQDVPLTRRLAVYAAS